ncbi:MAG TPA: thiamine-phosphate kinase [Gammaproteobacteria bacterium]|jgi:thiamine-monophosphate kinase|nr:thiamine-phosphate kinase [Gammaproteobacteria bacterium]
MDEFELIRRHFAAPAVTRDDVVLGIGDDAALLRVPPDQELAVSTDSLVSGVHFPPDFDPEAIGHRSLASNLSDLAAMGAKPAWVLMALTLPEADESWLTAFSRGFFALAKRHGVALVGGNVARGPLNITLAVHGFVPKGRALTRAGAQPGDLVYITGHPGDAAAGLKLLQAGKADMQHPCVRRFAYPEPRLAAGEALRGLASAAIDVSDGLLADLAHLTEARHHGAKLALDKLPLSPELQQLHGQDEACRLALTGGDDYELCFTVHAAQASAVEQRMKETGCPVACIGSIEAPPGIHCVDAAGRLHEYPHLGHRHF